MSKRSSVIFIIFCIASMILFNGCAGNTETSTTPNTTHNEGEEQMSDCRLIVNGKNIAAGHHVEYIEGDYYFELPFVAIMEALGAKVQWRSETTATVLFNDINYTLNTRECTMFINSKENDVLVIPPGGIRRYRTVNGEFVLDSNTVHSAMFLLDRNIRVNIDYENKTVEIIG